MLRLHDPLPTAGRVVVVGHLNSTIVPTKAYGQANLDGLVLPHRWERDHFRYPLICSDALAPYYSRAYSGGHLYSTIVTFEKSEFIVPYF